MEMVAAKTDEARNRAVGRLSGILEQEIREIKEALVGVLAATELFLDYSEDDGIGPSDEEEGILPERAVVMQAKASLEQLSASTGGKSSIRMGLQSQ
ncbi:hypothetical protein MASR2M78_09580 [Treponema sp.]